MTALAAGIRLGPYEIVAAIGAGGMGEVYRARDTRLGRDVAIKVLPPEFASDPNRLRRFEQEARAVAALSHPNIVALHDVGTHEGAPFLVSELLEGETLRDRLTDGGLTVRKAVETAIQIAQGLAAAHEKGIVHRDLKPANVFITKDGHVKILDFGIAKLTRPDPGPQAAALRPVVRRCLEKRPEERFSSAHDLAFALEAVGANPFDEGETGRRRVLGSSLSVKHRKPSCSKVGAVAFVSSRSPRAGVALRTSLAHDGEMPDLDRWQPYSLVAAALTLLVGLVFAREIVIGLVFCEIGCLAFIWAAGVFAGFIGLGVTQETPEGCVVVAGWAVQLFLLLAVIALAVLRLVRG